MLMALQCAAQYTEDVELFRRLVSILSRNIFRALTRYSGYVRSDGKSILRVSVSWSVASSRCVTPRGVSGVIVLTWSQGLIALNDPTYEPQRWHATLLTIAIIASAICFNTFLAVRLPLIEGIVLVLHLCGIFAIVIPLWVMAPRAPAKVALLDFVDNGGWSSTGLSAMIGLVTPLNVLIGYDCSVHMCKCTVSRRVSVG
jgi:choline transport protein